jgi:acetyl-CoA carboxylase biotin carboxyl carrier protein
MARKKIKAKVQKPAAKQSSSPMSMDLLEKMVKLMACNDLNTVDVRDGDKRIILRRGAVQMAMPMTMAAAPQPMAAHAGPAPAAIPAAAPSEDAGLVAIKSPMVGTFYGSPSPEAKPFVAVGTKVNEDTDVCIIEAMKVFNNIKAECRGTIAKILVTNGQTVEFGQTLFLVKP